MVCKLFLDYSTYLGGSDTDTAWAVKVDSALNAYIAGQSWSADFPTVNPYQAGLPGFGNVVVSKFSSSGSSLIYSTYLGGSVVDEVRGLALDSLNCAYLGGYTISHDFPTVNAYQGTLGGGFGDFDYFISKLSSAGSDLIYSTYLGGSDPDQGGAIAVDTALCAYITGMTYSGDFPTLNPYQGVIPGSSAATVSRISSDGATLLYSSYLGGSAGTAGSGIAVDDGLAAYLVGYTDSADFPTMNPYQASFQAQTEADAFVTKFSSTGSTLLYSTYLGGSGFDDGRGIALGTARAAYLVGITDSDDFPTANPYQPSRAGNDDVWMVKLASSGSVLLYSSYLGSSGDDYSYGIAVDGEERAYAVGKTYASDFPLSHPYQSVMQGIDAFLTRFDASGSALLYSTFLGGSNDDQGNAVAVDSLAAAYVTGFTASTDFPIENAYQSIPGGGGDIFLAKFSWDCYLTTPTPSVTPSPSVTPPTTPSLTPTPSVTPMATATPMATPSVTPVLTATPSPTPTCGPTIDPQRAVIASGDYDGDGTADIAIFRASSGLWAIRGISRAYFGVSGDFPVPGDYSGDDRAEIAIYRGSSGLWAVRGLTRIYMGSGGIPVPGDYDGDGFCDAGVFTDSSGRWQVRDVTSVFYGKSLDWPILGDFNGDGTAEIGIFRETTGLWAIRGYTRAYYGQEDDWPVPGDYDGDGIEEIVIWRPCSGLWAMREITRVYYGACIDWPRPADYDGNGTDDAGIFRETTSLWGVCGITRAYFGTLGDIPAMR